MDLNQTITVTPLETELIAGLLVGMGLSAATGLRLFVPPLMLSMGALYFGIQLPESLQWLGSQTAFFILLTAMLLEVGAYYVPWLDNLLDHVAMPLAVISGTLLTSSFLGDDLNPAWKWSLAIIAGGATAGTVQSLTTVTRLASSGLTFGLGNVVVSTVENVASAIVAAFAVLFPLVTIGLLLVVILFFWFVARSFQRRHHTSQNLIADKNTTKESS